MNVVNPNPAVVQTDPPQAPQAPVYDRIMAADTQAARRAADAAEAHIEATLRNVTMPQAPQAAQPPQPAGQPQPAPGAPNVLAPAPQPQQGQQAGPADNTPVNVVMPDGSVVQTTMAAVQSGSVTGAAPQPGQQAQQQPGQQPGQPQAPQAPQPLPDINALSQNYANAMARHNHGNLVQQANAIDTEISELQGQIQQLTMAQRQWSQYASQATEQADQVQASTQLSMVTSQLTARQTELSGKQQQLSNLDSSINGAAKRAMMEAAAQINPAFATDAGLGQLYSQAAQTYSFTEGDLAGTTDPRILMVLNDALQYRRLSASAQDWVTQSPQVAPAAIAAPVGPAPPAAMPDPSMGASPAMINPGAMLPANLGQMDIDEASNTLGAILDQLGSTGV